MGLAIPVSFTVASGASSDVRDTLETECQGCRAVASVGGAEMVRSLSAAPGMRGATVRGVGRRERREG